MNNWQTFYSASEQAIILAKHQRGIGFPAELYQRAPRLVNQSSLSAHRSLSTGTAAAFN